MSLPSSAHDDLVPILKALGLTALGTTLPTVLEQARQQQPTYDAFLRLALQAEVSGRAERAHARRLRAARLPARKTLESFDFRFQPSVPERLIRELATLGFVETATNLIFLGPPGVGKTHPPDYPSRPHVLADRCGHGH
jgi:DNA replication protein DnaC